MELSIEVEEFLKTYQTNANSGKTSEIAKQFAYTFMAADPEGARPVTASTLAAAIPQRKKLMDGIGCVSTALAWAEEQWLDERYVVVRTKWRLDFDSTQAKRELSLSSTFLLYRSADGVKVVFYLSHEALMDVLRNGGFVKSNAT